MKITTFIWKLLHDSLPVLTNLIRRGIQIANRCLMCDEGEETMSHLFLQCPFAKAVWYSSSLGIRTSELNHLSMKHWLLGHITATNMPVQTKQSSLQSIFTILWTIQTHKNLVLHNGKTPNLVEVIPTSQSFIYRFKEAFNLYKGYNHYQRSKNRTKDCRQNWQLLIKVVATKKKRTRRSGFAFEARCLDGSILFKGGASSGVKIRHQAAQEALLLALMKAKDIGYQRLYVISNDKYLVQIFNYVKNAGWIDRTFLSNFSNLHQQGLITKILFVPRIVIHFVLDLANKTTRYLIHCIS